MNGKLNWQEIWKDPSKVLDQVDQNQQALLWIGNTKERLKKEIKERIKIKKGGYVFEEEHKKELIEEVKKIDTVLADRISKLDNKYHILIAFDERMKELKGAIEHAENKIKYLLTEEEKTIGNATTISQRFLQIQNEVIEKRKKQIEKLAFGSAFKKRIREAAQQGKQIVLDNIVQFKNDARKWRTLLQESNKIEEDIVKLQQEVKQLQARAKGIMHRFELETEGIKDAKKLKKPEDDLEREAA